MGKIRNNVKLYKIETNEKENINTYKANIENLIIAMLFDYIKNKQ